MSTAIIRTPCGTASPSLSARPGANVFDLDTHLVHAARWCRVLHGCAAPRAWKPEDAEEVRARRDIIDCAFEAVRAWGTPDMVKQARKDARKARRICDLAADFCLPLAPVVDLAAYRARRAS
jgi:hypothetical protein